MLMKLISICNIIRFKEKFIKHDKFNLVKSALLKKDYLILIRNKDLI